MVSQKREMFHATNTPLGRHPPGQTPPPQQTATAVDGTHPTGMHSCFIVVVALLLQLPLLSPRLCPGT